MAHGTLLSDKDIKFLASKNVGLAHCPLSNFFLGDACFRSEAQGIAALAQPLLGCPRSCTGGIFRCRV